MQNGSTNGALVKTTRLKLSGGPTIDMPMGNQGTQRRRRANQRTLNVLKDAVLFAAQCSGRDGDGYEGLHGYLMRIARFYPKEFTGLLARIIPLQVHAMQDVQVTFRSAADVRRELEERGIPVPKLFQDDE